MISAEGKNPDITEALDRARHHSARPIHILTNRSDSPLMAGASKLSDVSAHVEHCMYTRFSHIRIY